MKKIIIVRMKYPTDTAINLLVSIMKSAVASMIAIAVSRDYLLHQSAQSVQSPNRIKTPPVIKRAVFISGEPPAIECFVKPIKTHAAPPPKKESNIIPTATKARHLAQLLMSHMNIIEIMSPVKMRATFVFHV